MYDMWDPLNPKPYDMWEQLTEWKLPSISHLIPPTKKKRVVGATPTQHLQPNLRRVGAVPKTRVDSAALRSAPTVLQPNTQGNKEAVGRKLVDTSGHP
jgi:hypothetical protein